MKQIYADPRAASEKGQLFTLMQGYSADHYQDFDQGFLAVFGSEDQTGLIGQSLLKAVHHVFTTKSLADLGHGPDPTVIIKLAMEFENHNRVDDGSKDSTT